MLTVVEAVFARHLIGVKSRQIGFALPEMSYLILISKLMKGSARWRFGVHPEGTFDDFDDL